MSKPVNSNTHIVFLSLGANLGHREQTLRCAMAMLEQQIGNCLSCSGFYYSPAWGYESHNDYCNICAKFSTQLSPNDLLNSTQAIERSLGRIHKGGFYQDRTIDIDILLYDQLSIQTPQLTIPHPKMHEREFVRIPLSELI